MKTLALVLLLSMGVAAQEFIGTSATRAFYIDKVEQKNEMVTFLGTAAVYKVEGKTRIILDPNNYLVTLFVANCKTFEYLAVTSNGKKEGKDFSEIPEQKVRQAKSPEIIFKALLRACKLEGNDG